MSDEEIISDFIQLTSGKAFNTDSAADDIVGNLYAIKYGDMTLDNNGIINGKYELDDKTILLEIEALLFDYLPLYNGGRLEFQSDLMPDRLLFHDTNSNDGWIYRTDNINEIFDASKESYTNWPATYVLYAEVKLADGTIKQTAVMPIYYITD